MSDTLLIFFAVLSEPLQPHHIPKQRHKPWPVAQIERIARMYHATMAAKTEANPITQQIRQIGKHAFRFAVMHLNRPTHTPTHLTGILVS
jgi:hypothetical protein